MKEVQNKNHTDEAKRLNEELDQNLKDLQPESKEAFQGFEVKEEKNEKKPNILRVLMISKKVSMLYTRFTVLVCIKGLPSRNLTGS